MKLLLDENLPHQMRAELPRQDVFTTAYMGWRGIENGALLRLAAEAEFDALITNDRGMEYQQSSDSLPLKVVVIVAKANTIESIRLLLPALLDTLSQAKSYTFLKVAGS